MRGPIRPSSAPPGVSRAPVTSAPSTKAPRVLILLLAAAAVTHPLTQAQPGSPSYAEPPLAVSGLTLQGAEGASPPLCPCFSAR